MSGNTGVVEHGGADNVWYTAEVDGKPLCDKTGQPRRFMTGYAAGRALDFDRAAKARVALRPDWKEKEKQP